MMTQDQAIARVTHELQRALSKHPGSNPSAHHAYAVLLEEVDEAWDEIKVNNLGKAHEEMVQVAAMAIRFLMEVQ